MKTIKFNVSDAMYDDLKKCAERNGYKIELDGNVDFDAFIPFSMTMGNIKYLIDLMNGSDEPNAFNRKPW